jgi:YHS domain-containing protein
MARFAFVLISALLAGAAADAGPQYVDSNGFAASGYDVVAYFDLPQSKLGAAQQSAVPGRSDLVVQYNGARFAFANDENRRRFVADPEKYVPQYDGHCAYGVSRGGKVPGNPNLWRIVDGKLYLNITKSVARSWEKNIPENIIRAEDNWQALEREAASSDAVPDFRSDAPIKQ